MTIRGKYHVTFLFGRVSGIVLAIVVAPTFQDRILSILFQLDVSFLAIFLLKIESQEYGLVAIVAPHR
jgi:hypothetical protein